MRAHPVFSTCHLLITSCNYSHPSAASGTILDASRLPKLVSTCSLQIEHVKECLNTSENKYYVQLCNSNFTQQVTFIFLKPHAQNIYIYCYMMKCIYSTYMTDARKTYMCIMVLRLIFMLQAADRLINVCCILYSISAVRKTTLCFVACGVFMCNFTVGKLFFS